jgi:hypothetical protein
MYSQNTSYPQSYNIEEGSGSGGITLLNQIELSDDNPQPPAPHTVSPIDQVLSDDYPDTSIEDMINFEAKNEDELEFNQRMRANPPIEI